MDEFTLEKAEENGLNSSKAEAHTGELYGSLPVDIKTAEPEKEQDRFMGMYQGLGTNLFASVYSRKNNAVYDKHDKTMTIEKGALSVITKTENDMLEVFQKLFTSGVHKTFDILTIELTHQNDYKSKKALKTRVSLSLKEYMEKRGIPLTKPSWDKTTLTVEAELKTLLNTRLEWREGTNKKTIAYEGVNICGDASIKNGRIEFDFSPKLANYLVSSFVMQYPVQLLRLDGRNQLTYCLGRKMALHYGMRRNIENNTNDIISVLSLRECCEHLLPSYDVVSKEDRHFDRRIITPFENALDILKAENVITSWEYCNSGKMPLSDEQLEGFSKPDYYYIWDKLFVHFTISNFPNTSVYSDKDIEKAEKIKKHSSKNIK